MNKLTNRFTSDILGIEEPVFGEKAIGASEELAQIVGILQDRGICRMPLVHQVLHVNHFLFTQKCFRFRLSQQGYSFALSQTMSEGGGNCLGLTILYAAIAAELDIGVNPLLFEGHVAMCFNDSGGIQPIEISRSGSLLKGLPAELMYKGKGAPQVISLAQLSAVHLANFAVFICAPRDGFDKAIVLLQRVVNTFPNYIGAWINLAQLFLALGDFSQGEKCLEKTFALSPKGPYLTRANLMDQSVRYVKNECRRVSQL